jgi:hypothetical protein
MRFSSISRVLVTLAVAAAFGSALWNVGGRWLTSSDMLQLWLYYAIPSVVVALILVPLSWPTARWRLWELSAFMVPFLVWCAADEIFPGSKSISNLIEVLALGAMLLLSVTLRAALGRHFTRARAAGLQVFLCAWALLIFLAVPGLPE